MGELACASLITRNGGVLVAVCTALDPQGSGGVNVLTHPYPTAACATGRGSHRDRRYIRTDRAVATMGAERHAS